MAYIQSEYTNGLVIATALTGTELAPIFQGGLTVQTTTQDIADLAGAVIPNTEVMFGQGTKIPNSSSNLTFNSGTDQLTLWGKEKIGDGDTPYFNVFGGALLQVSKSLAADCTAILCKNEHSEGRSALILEGDFQVDSPCYAGMLMYGSAFDPLETPWANRMLFQSGGRNLGQTIFVNEGDWELVIAYDDGVNIIFDQTAMYATPWWRHDTFARDRPGGLIGINTKLPTAQLTITGGTLGGDTGIDFKRLFDATATMPSTITAGEYDAIKWNITGGTTDKNHLHILDNATTVLKLNSNFIQIPKHTTGEINAISSPVEGMHVFNTTLHQLCYYNGSGWRKVTDSAM